MNFIHSVLEMAFFLFGIGIFLRFSTILMGRSQQSDIHIRLLHKFYLAFSIMISIFFPMTLTFAFFFNLFVWSFLLIFIFFVKNKRQRQFYNFEIQFIRKLFLKISSGKSIVDALQAHLQKDGSDFEEFNNEVAKLVTFRQQTEGVKTRKSELRTVYWVKNIVDNPVNTLEKLKSIEEKLQIEHDFRRKSGQALLGVRMQALIMAVIYILALVFILLFFGMPKSIYPLVFSLTLFGMGMLWVLKIGKVIKWKV